MPSVYTLPDLPYDCSALEPHCSGRIVELHHDKHHAAYVAGANATLEQLADARGRDDFTALNQLEKSLAFHVSGHVLHSLLWTNLSPSGGGRLEGELDAAIAECFGSFDAMRSQMNAVASSVQGSGWAVLAWEPLGARLVVEQVHDHQGNVGNGAVPLLVLDMWEHAYYLQYEHEKQRWIDAYWHLVGWPDVADRFDRVRALRLP